MSPDVSIYVELLVCVWEWPALPLVPLLTYCGGEGTVLEGCDPEPDDGVEGNTELGGSKKSGGEKASGLLW